MDGEAGWWTTSGKIRLPPLAMVMGVDRQQQKQLFKNQVRQQRVPFVIYADFECFTSKVDTYTPNPDTFYTHISNPRTIGFLLSSGMRLFQAEHGCGGVWRLEVVETFIDWLQECEQQITTILDNPVPINLAQDEEASFQSAQACYVCHHPLVADRIHDHDYLKSTTICSL